MSILQLPDDIIIEIIVLIDNLTDLYSFLQSHPRFDNVLFRYNKFIIKNKCSNDGILQFNNTFEPINECENDNPVDNDYMYHRNIYSEKVQEPITLTFDIMFYLLQNVLENYANLNQDTTTTNAIESLSIPRESAKTFEIKIKEMVKQRSIDDLYFKIVQKNGPEMQQSETVRAEDIV
jgi:hypothetical protein